MKKISIIALHLAYGGIEKAIISMANLFAERYDVEIISVYNMPNSPAFPLDDRVSVRYLMDETPNREEWKKAYDEKNLPVFFRESFKALRIIRRKKRSVIKAIKGVKDGVLITTRHEDNLLLSKYGSKDVLKIAQLHHDHRFEKEYVEGFRDGYSNIDIFALLTPGLRDEAAEIMKDNGHTKQVFIPNFLERYPDMSVEQEREKTVVSVGRLDPVKGFDRLIRIFSTVAEENPEWKLKIIGEGEERVRLEAMIDELGLEGRVVLTGRLDSFQLEEELKKASIFAMTSHSEGFGFVIIEAQSCKLPCVVFDVRVGAKMIITDGVDGFLIPDDDEVYFAEKLNELIHSPELREETGARAMVRAGDFFPGEGCGNLVFCFGE